jgi:putative hydrolase of the HAD superfamily
LSLVAEFARELHERHPVKQHPPVIPLYHSALKEKLFDIRTVTFDVYGTLIDYWRPEFDSEERKQRSLSSAFRQTADFFQMTEKLSVINPQDAPENTLRDFYHGLIALQHEKSVKKGVAYPEVRIEEVWQIIVMMLQRHGYDPDRIGLGERSELSRCMAYYYHFNSLGRGFFPGVVETLEALVGNNIKLGIVSNAQFYTPIDLTLFIRDQSNGRYDDYTELFDPTLVFFSYEYGAAKPNQMLLGKLFDSLYEHQILPSQAVFAGNDLSADILPAKQAGMQTAFFIGDRRCAFGLEASDKVVPDITFADWGDLPEKISFYEEKI